MQYHVLNLSQTSWCKNFIDYFMFHTLYQVVLDQNSYTHWMTKLLNTNEKICKCKNKNKILKQKINTEKD